MMVTSEPKQNELTEEDENKMYRCMICKKTGKPYKFFEDLYLGMNAHFVRHHPDCHSEMMEKHVEALVNGEWLKPKSIVVDEAFTKKPAVKKEKHMNPEPEEDKPKEPEPEEKKFY